MRVWKNGSVSMLLVIFSGTVFLMSGCEKKGRDSCPAKGAPSQYWAKYNLPKVEGAELCEDYTFNTKHTIGFTHYLDGDKKFKDFVNLYEGWFKDNGWTIEKVASSGYSTIYSKGSDRLSLGFEDCYGGRDFSSTRRPCLSVKISEPPDVDKPKNNPVTVTPNNEAVKPKK